MYVDPREIYAYLRSRWGLSDAAAAAVVVNIQYESSFYSGAEGDKELSGGSSWGLFQHRGSRWVRLQSYAASHGSSWTNWQIQVDFAMEGPGEAFDLGFDIHATDAAAATRWWTTVFERPANADEKADQRAGDVAQYQYGDEGMAHVAEAGDGQEVLNLPEGGSWFRVGNEYYVAYRFYGNNDKTGPSQVVYYKATIPPPPDVTIHSEASWNKWHDGWVDGGSTDALRGIAPGTSYQDLVNDLLLEMGLWGTDAMSDPGVMAIIAIALTRDMSEAELANRLRQTDWWNQRTDDERVWNDLSDAEKALRVVDEAMDLVGLWFTYVGEDLDVGQYDIDGDGVVSADELRRGNPALYEWAAKIASGEITQAQAVNVWMKPEALKIEDSPWSRTVREEEIKSGKHETDISNMAGRIRDLYYDWGIPITDDKAQDLAERVVLNQMSFEDVEEALEEQAQGMYPHKPEGMATREWAQPYMQMYMQTLEVSQVDLDDPYMARGLADGMNLADFKQMLRDDDRWLETDGARGEMNTKISQLGRTMGF